MNRGTQTMRGILENDLPQKRRLSDNERIVVQRKLEGTDVVSIVSRNPFVCCE